MLYEIKLENARKERDRITNAIDELRLDHGPLNEEIIFPSNGKECIAYFREHIRGLVKIVEKATKQFDQQKEKTIKQEQVLDTAIEQL